MKNGLLILSVVLLTFTCFSGCLEEEGGEGSGIGPEGGVKTFSSVKLEFPEDALDSEEEITIKEITSMINTTNLVNGKAYQFGPSGLTFKKAVTLTIDYDRSDLPNGSSEDDLRIAYLLNDDWMPLNSSSVDRDEMSVSAEILHFSVYGLIDSVDSNQDGDPDDNDTIDIPPRPSFTGQEFSNNFNTFVNGGTIDATGWSNVMGTWAVHESVHTITSIEGSREEYYYYYSSDLATHEVSTAHSGVFSNFTYSIPWFHYDCSEMGFYFRADPTSPEDDGLWSNGYRVRIMKAGAYYNFILEVIIDGEWSLLTEDWPSVYAGDITDPDMTTVITCNGPYIYLSFAGMDIWEGKDETFSSGQVGIFGGVGPSSNAIEPRYAKLYT